MSIHNSGNGGGPINVFQLMRSHRNLWLIPALVVFGLVTVYALFRSDTWEATQALIVRNEASGNTEAPGRFRQMDEMKTTQATIMELTRSRTIIESALKEAGPPPRQRINRPWPSQEDVSDFLESMKLVPPKGAEFGTTEVIYLKVTEEDRERAIDLAGAMSKTLSEGFQKLRESKFDSMILELQRGVTLAEQNLNQATKELSALEMKVGPDLGELRNLFESAVGDGDLRKKSLEIENELRQAELANRNSKELRDLLLAAKDDQDRLLATPNRLLESQPALKRLKDGLIDAQLQTSQLLGSMSPEHPKVQGSIASEKKIVQALHEEIDAAVHGIDEDVNFNTGRVNMLTEQLDAVKMRLQNLAEIRAPYSNLVAASKHRAKLLEDAQKNLADAKALQASSLSSSLINIIDDPDTGTRPQGPGRKTLIAAGALGGLLFGLGILFFVAPMAAKSFPEEEPRQSPIEVFQARVVAPTAPASIPLARPAVVSHETKPAESTIENGNGGGITASHASLNKFRAALEKVSANVPAKK